MDTAKTVLITGASSGIGLEMAKIYRQMNFKVYACARRLDRMAELKEMGCIVISLDVTSEESIAGCFDTVRQNGDFIDILVNNAGYGSYGPMENTPMEEVRRQFEVNFFGLVRVTQMFLPAMRVARKGVIINISSIAGTFTVPFGGWYHSSKHAVESYSDSLRQEVKKFGIKVIIIEPGLIKTEWGIIAADNIRKIMPGNPYEEDLGLYADYLDRNYREKNSSTPPAEIARKIVKVSLKKNPSFRYRFGKMAGLVVWLKHHMPEKFFDFLVKMFVRN